MTQSERAEARFYDAYYFQHGCGQPYERNAVWLQFFGGIAQKIVETIGPRTALDAGCAMGFLVEGLRERGVDAFGVDISEYAIGQAHESIRPYCWVGSVSAPLPQRYDMIVCIEVLEHLRQPESEAAIANFCRFSDDILFSSTPFDYREATHFNVQPPEYWADQFARHGFVRDVDFDASFITPWAVRFRQSREPQHQIIRDYERRFWLLWKENTDLRSLAVDLRNQLAASEQTALALRTQITDHERERQALVEQTQTLQAQLRDFTHQPSWRIAQLLQQLRLWLAPPATRRERWLSWIVKALMG